MSQTRLNTNQKVKEGKLTEALLAQSDALQLIQTVLFAGTVDDGVFQHLTLHAVKLNSGGIVALNLPNIAALVVDQAWGIVALVQVLEEGGKDLGVFIREGDTLAGGFHVLLPQDGAEVWRLGQDILVSREYSLFRANH